MRGLKIMIAKLQARRAVFFDGPCKLCHTYTAVASDGITVRKRNLKRLGEVRFYLRNATPTGAAIEVPVKES